MTIGERFRAGHRLGLLARGDAMLATFTVTRISRAGIVYADGIVDDRTRDGKPFGGLKRRSGVRFKASATHLREFNPDIKPGWREIPAEA